MVESRYTVEKGDVRVRRTQIGGSDGEGYEGE
jgi:hypothetical protein